MFAHIRFICCFKVHFFHKRITEGYITFTSNWLLHATAGLFHPKGIIMWLMIPLWVLDETVCCGNLGWNRLLSHLMHDSSWQPFEVNNYIISLSTGCIKRRPLQINLIVIIWMLYKHCAEHKNAKTQLMIPLITCS